MATTFKSIAAQYGVSFSVDKNLPLDCGEYNPIDCKIKISEKYKDHGTTTSKQYSSMSLVTMLRSLNANHS